MPSPTERTVPTSAVSMPRSSPASCALMSCVISRALMSVIAASLFLAVCRSLGSRGAGGALEGLARPGEAAREGCVEDLAPEPDDEAREERGVDLGPEPDPGPGPRLEGLADPPRGGVVERGGGADGRLDDAPLHVEARADRLEDGRELREA